VPSPTWERFVVTGKARARIRRFIRAQQRHQFLDLGRSMLLKAFKAEGYDYADKSLEGAVKPLKAEDVEDLIADLAPALDALQPVGRAVWWPVTGGSFFLGAARFAGGALTGLGRAARRASSSSMTGRMSLAAITWVEAPCSTRRAALARRVVRSASVMVGIMSASGVMSSSVQKGFRAGARGASPSAD